MRNRILFVGLMGVVIGLLLAAAGIVLAGSLNPSVGPSQSGSQVYTLEQIYDRLTSEGNAAKMGTFTEPTDGPLLGTMHTLDDIYPLTWPARVPKTGQTTSYAAGDDGDLEKGVAWPGPRFTDNGDGTVTDNLTGLIWLRQASCGGQQSWAQALAGANGLASGSCGLTDGSTAGQWRLPNLRELQSLVDYGRLSPALPSGHPFTDVRSYAYWTSGTSANNSTMAWQVDLTDGYVGKGGKTGTRYVWPVRGGQ